jgi:glutaredoxin
MSALQTMSVQFKIPNDKGFSIYTKTSCIFCTKVKELLDKNKIEYTIINCDIYLEDHKDIFLEYVKTIIGKEYRTFPMVFLDGKFIGGFTDTEKYIEQEKSFSNEDF